MVPLTIAATPFFARIAEVSLREVDHGLIEAAQAMGCRRWHIVWHVLLPEALPGIVGGARAYHQARGDCRRTQFIGRAKGYHGMGFGGLSVSGIGRQKRDFGPLLGEVSHLPLPYDAGMRFSVGQPQQLADRQQLVVVGSEPALSPLSQ